MIAPLAGVAGVGHLVDSARWVGGGGSGPAQNADGSGGRGGGGTTSSAPDGAGNTGGGGAGDWVVEDGGFRYHAFTTVGSGPLFTVG